MMTDEQIEKEPAAAHMLFIANVFGWNMGPTPETHKEGRHFCHGSRGFNDAPIYYTIEQFASTAKAHATRRGFQIPPGTPQETLIHISKRLAVALRKAAEG